MLTHLALILAPLAPVTPCPGLAGVRTVADPGVLVADWREVHGALYADEALPANTPLALDRLCTDRGTCGPAHRVSAVVGAMHDQVAVVVTEGEKLRIFKDLSSLGGPGKTTIRPLGSGTWIQVEAESLGREPFCETNADGEEECVTATVISGYEYTDIVVEGGKVLWVASCLTEGDTQAPSTLTLEAGQYALQPCGGGTPVRFSLPHLQGCTAVNHPPQATVPGTGTAAAPELVAKHLAEGRKATKEKRFSDAIAAFDALLKIDEKHARARSERGFAKLIQGDLDGAERDFDQAIEHAQDDIKVRASSWFNKGLIAEKRGNPVAAKAAFEQAHQLNPSAATKGKLGLP